MRTVRTRLVVLPTLLLLVLSVFAGGTVRGQPSCTVTRARKIAPAVNIFSLQQERALGDIEAEWVENNYQAVHDEELAAHLHAIAGRVLAQFPGDSVPVHVILIDAPEAQSFSIGPERIYITRKMVGSLRNDDELAGLLGHELGHILNHQNAIIVSQLFRAILGVNAVGDRNDILEKLNRMLGSIDHDKKSLRKAAEIVERQEWSLQNEADHVALYASAAAGFSPQSYVELFERLAGTNGSNGSVLTDYFGATTSNLRRLREIQKAMRELPRPCREMVPAASAGFRTWQAAVMSDTDLAR